MPTISPGKSCPNPIETINIPLTYMHIHLGKHIFYQLLFSLCCLYPNEWLPSFFFLLKQCCDIDDKTFHWVLEFAFQHRLFIFHRSKSNIVWRKRGEGGSCMYFKTFLCAFRKTGTFFHIEEVGMQNFSGFWKTSKIEMKSRLTAFLAGALQYIVKE